MPAILCKCGNRLSLGAIPNPNEWLMISDIEYDEFQGEIDSEKLYMKFKSIIICPNCNRLILFWNDFNHNPIFYKVDNE
ncbi:hypothetical protein C7G91_08655 [Acinetobacter nosocomialis]|uniref:hypothetical protein n=1 Tax=Acinetobacter nosocomialis TaxID=106654 RepID=UPI000D0BE896|nr:hypothetical protein [Acinetobacter nosocomialis]PSE43614.1 hypothetical protein C7G97_13350 [Acinetobacter nosocomialis]PSE83683.1 hypothetical protein C7G91_08655 [Acinetobacter nosocomialis]